ncbi:putative metal-dependent hydrolase [Peribacillus simplex]|uniref:YfiT family bacillithiol transferase n=1 Tax=Peribacillus simplex TaxID=1478 RepID=UPI0025A173B2|nr:putative metal-dependent hydrolase [Peribacillus simplex]MDM5291763.1 putative metal-dependent hydrolase [Peribacillus simplex]
MDNRYPIGQFDCPNEVQEKDIQMWIKEMTTLPSRLNELIVSLDESKLTKTYRENSWNVRQLIHHIIDSHLNGYMRMKLALTEENPVVKTYEESEWAKLIDYELPIKVSLQLLESLHERWTYLLKNLTDTQLQRTYQYPDGSKMRIEQSIALYAWHGNHHLAHIQQALNK